MMMNVTRGERAVAGGLRALEFPGAHVNPSAFFGQHLDVRWPVRNDGGVAASCRMEIRRIAGLLTVIGVDISLLPGAQLTLILLSPALVDGTHVQTGANSCQVHIVRSSDGALLGQHDFTLTMIAPAALVAVGDPTITVV